MANYEQWKQSAKKPLLTKEKSFQKDLAQQGLNYVYKVRMINKEIENRLDKSDVVKNFEKWKQNLNKYQENVKDISLKTKQILDQLKKFNTREVQNSVQNIETKFSDEFSKFKKNATELTTLLFRSEKGLKQQNDKEGYIQMLNKVTNEQQKDQQLELEKQKQIFCQNIMFEEVDFEKQLIQERGNKLLQIEQFSQEISGLMKVAAFEVESQGRSVDVISTNVESTKNSVKNASKEMKSANDYSRKSNRKTFFFILCIVVMLILVFLIVYLQI